MFVPHRTKKVNISASIKVTGRGTWQVKINLTYCQYSQVTIMTTFIFAFILCFLTIARHFKNALLRSRDQGGGFSYQRKECHIIIMSCWTP
jgi:hypothetical protein